MVNYDRKTFIVQAIGQNTLVAAHNNYPQILEYVECAS